jgi:alanyl-tRNA synthetase
MLETKLPTGSFLFYNNAMPKTKLIYLEDSYQQTSSATVTSVSTEGSTTTITMDQTIFYPQGGGQPGDKGTITAPGGELNVSHTQYRNGTVEHLGKLKGSLSEGDRVNLHINWNLRYQHMQWHTAGHILDEAVKATLPEFHGIDGMHGIGKKLFIVYKGFIDSTHKHTIQTKITELIKSDLPITSRLVTSDDIQNENIFIPFELPKNKPLRLVHIGDLPPIPDGGTQLKSTGVLWLTEIADFEYDNGNTIIHYQVKPPEIPKSPEKTTKIYQQLP